MKLDKSATQEQTERTVLPAGIYKFEVRNCVYKINRNNEPMWEIQMSFPDEPAARWVYDYIVEKDSMMWKFNQLFNCVGLDADDTSDLKYIIGDIGHVRLEVEQSDQYGPRNRVKAYIRMREEPKAEPAAKPAKKKAPKISVPESDDLPF